jgi:hypothetical protein
VGSCWLGPYSLINFFFFFVYLEGSAAVGEHEYGDG